MASRVQQSRQSERGDARKWWRENKKRVRGAFRDRRNTLFSDIDKVKLMPRARNIKPGFFKNENLAACSPMARLLFPGTWILADREGRLEDRPLRIKAEIFPYDNCDVDALLAELADRGLISRYEVSGAKIIQVIKFSQHQNPHQNEAPSQLPPMPSTTPVQASECSRTTPVQALKSSDATPAESLLLNPESLTLNPECGKKARALKPHPDVISNGFDAFWRLYPKKVDKANAKAVWKSLAPSKELQVEIMAKLSAQIKTDAWIDQGGKFIPGPAKYLRGRRWEDEVANVSKVSVGNGDGFVDEHGFFVRRKWSDEEMAQMDAGIRERHERIEALKSNCSNTRLDTPDLNESPC